MDDYPHEDKKGTIREDGRIFFQYRWRKGIEEEVWLSRDSYDKCVQSYHRWRSLNKEAHRAVSRRWMEENLESYREKKRLRDRNNREHASKLKRESRRRCDAKGSISRIRERLATNCRARIHAMLKKNKSCCDYIGLTSPELCRYLESKFQDGMNWGNYGLHGWHVDHIVPLASASTLEEIIPLLHYSNLQPLWAEENIAKRDKMPVGIKRG